MEISVALHTLNNENKIPFYCVVHVGEYTMKSSDTKELCNCVRNHFYKAASCFVEMFVTVWIDIYSPEDIHFIKFENIMSEVVLHCWNIPIYLVLYRDSNSECEPDDPAGLDNLYRCVTIAFEKNVSDIIEILDVDVKNIATMIETFVLPSYVQDRIFYKRKENLRCYVPTERKFLIKFLKARWEDGCGTPQENFPYSWQCRYLKGNSRSPSWTILYSEEDIDNIDYFLNLQQAYNLCRGFISYRLQLDDDAKRYLKKHNLKYIHVQGDLEALFLFLRLIE